MLLIVTERGDLTVDYLILELEARGASFVRFNTEDFPTRVGFVWRPDGGALRLRGTSYPLSEFSSVWYRRPLPPQLPDTLPAEAALWAAREAREALHGAWRTLDAKWVNHPDANRLAESKPEQLRTAARLGFEIPATLVTNEPSALREFIDSQRSIICKPLWDGRVPVNGSEHLFFTSSVDPDRVPVDELGPEPYLFQALIPKADDVRATVIGDEVFAVRIESQAESESRVDWRRGAPGQLHHEPEQLPDEVAEGCLELCRHYGLRFGAIDLARRPDGGYTFFELNPNGQWAWIEQRTGLPLRARLADLLLAGMRA